MNNEEQGGQPVALEGLYNVRDLGGYPLPGDRRVRRGLLYRAGDLHAPTPGDRQVLVDLGLRTVVDLRGAEEKAGFPDVPLGPEVEYRELPIEAGNMVSLSRFWGGEDGVSLMEELYRIIVREARPQYRAFFALLVEGERAPLLFHCSAGKDRTGIAAALILSALGAERDLIYEDYLLSARYLGDKFQTLLGERPYLEPLISVRKSYLEAAFTLIEEDFGGTTAYLEGELGADTPRLREIYCSGS